MNAPLDAQAQASDPHASVFVAANAGSGKTSTLVKRVARLLLNGARPEAILCVTFTKAGAAEMQRRLFQQLGAWAVMNDADLKADLARIDEADRELSKARVLFARALETPGGLKVQTIHAFCEKLLRRFPLEAGVSPGFSVLEDVAAAQVSARARDELAGAAMDRPGSPIAQAYSHFSVQLDWASFNGMFATFEAKRIAISDYVAAIEPLGGYVRDVWRRCGFLEPTTRDAIETGAIARMRWGVWKRAAEAIARGAGATDKTLAEGMLAIGPESSFADLWAIFSTKNGSPRKRLGTNSVDAATRAWMLEEQSRHFDTYQATLAATVAEDTVHALTLAIAYSQLYEGEKTIRGALDFGDLISRTNTLLTGRADAAWVLYKLDGGLEHVLLDEAQDTAPDQWNVLRTLTAEFFSGEGAVSSLRTVFAVGDEKQSIFSFQGAAPERLAVESQNFRAMVSAAGAPFHSLPLLESWRSAPEILAFVDQVFTADEALTGLHPAKGDNVERLPIVHKATRQGGGCVELWPLEAGEATEDVDVWAPVDAEPVRSANKLLAARIAGEICAMVARGDGVMDRATTQSRPCRYGDVLILVRRRGSLFHEIIRALKRAGAPVSGADRLKLSGHGVFEDLMALGRFTRFDSDDLTLAGLLRSPFCDIDEASLFDLAFEREGTLWRALCSRGDEKASWRSARAFLTWAEATSRRATPFDFYCRVLSRLDDAGVSMRQRVLTRLGAEGQEAMDAFVAQALEAEARGVRDLESFLAAMAATELEIKREQDGADSRGPSEVRVMTVHGAKGLEAPIVILPDTTTRATAQGGPLLETDDGGFLWAPRKADDCVASKKAREDRDLATEHESARLLYVALTRARDRLIICGVESQAARFDNSWYHFVQQAFDNLPIRPFDRAGGGEAWRYGADPASVVGNVSSAAMESDPPGWAHVMAPEGADLARFASPSNLADSARGPALSPLADVGGLGRYRRGDLIHRLLQCLPDIPEAERADAAHRLLVRERDLGDDQRKEMADAALAVLGDEQFAAVFGQGSHAEVALAGAAKGLPAGLAISGRMDRLVVEKDRVMVVDFKTNRPAPDRIEAADPAYVQQMSIYAAVLAEIFPERKIEAALVWTDGPRLMPVPQSLIDATLAELRRAQA